MKRNKIFNENGEDSISKSMIGGDTTGLFNLSTVKYKWATDLYQVMVGNFWTPEKVSGLSDDAIQYKKLTDQERRAYDGIISFLVFLDSIQTANLPNISSFITASEVNLLLSIQASQEAIHSKSYETILDTVTPKDRRDEIAYFWKDDKILLDRIKYIGNIYQEFIDDQSEKNLFKVIVANFLLESIYFYNGFAFFDTLVYNQKMTATGRMISYIRRDEECLHPDTEVLTSNGWKSIEHVSTDDKVAQYDLGTEEVTFANPIDKIWKEYDGEMIRLIDNRGRVVQNITKNHDIVVRHLKSGIIKKERVCDSKFHPYKAMPTSGYSFSGKDKLSPLERFSIALQADGNIDKERNGTHCGQQQYNFGFSKERKVERFRKILSELIECGVGIRYTESILERKGDKKDMTTFRVKIDKNIYLDKNLDIFSIDDISTAYAKEFMEELIEWDGYKANDRSSGYWSNTNKIAVDKVMSILAISGYKHKSSISVDNRSDKFSDVYRVTWWRHINYRETQSIKKDSYDYSGMVGCVTMPTGAIITRHDNEVSVTGNCHITIFAGILKALKKERPDLYDEDLIVSMTKKAVEQEIEWTNHIIGDSIQGFSKEGTDKFTKNLANKRMVLLGIDPIYEGYATNPYKHLDMMDDNNAEKTNFFESTVVNYTQSTSMNGTWDF